MSAVATCEVNRQPDFEPTQKYNGPCVLVRLWTPSADSILSPTEEVSIYDYDGSGNMAKKHYCVDGEYSSETSYFYDDDGRLLREEEKWLDNTRAMGTVDYSYDQEGRLVRVEESRYMLRSIVTFEYDSAGQLIRESSHDNYPTGGTITTSDYVYNERGLTETIYQEMEHFGRAPMPRAVGTIRFEYDERNNVIEKRMDITHQYDIPEFDSMVWSWSYAYDEDGSILNENIVYEWVFFEGTVREIVGWEQEDRQYDEYENLLSSEKESGSGISENETYAYDCWQ